MSTNELSGPLLPREEQTKHMTAQQLTEAQVFKNLCYTEKWIQRVSLFIQYVLCLLIMSLRFFCFSPYGTQGTGF